MFPPARGDRGGRGRGARGGSDGGRGGAGRECGGRGRGYEDRGPGRGSGRGDEVVAEAKVMEIVVVEVAILLKILPMSSSGEFPSLFHGIMLESNIPRPAMGSFLLRIRTLQSWRMAL